MLKFKLSSESKVFTLKHYSLFYILVSTSEHILLILTFCFPIMSTDLLWPFKATTLPLALLQASLSCESTVNSLTFYLFLNSDLTMRSWLVQLFPVWAKILCLAPSQHSDCASSDTWSFSNSLVAVRERAEGEGSPTC